MDSGDPPYSSGTASPKIPMRFICSIHASGYSFACSTSRTAGLTSRSMKVRTVSTSMVSSSLSACVISTSSYRIDVSDQTGESESTASYMHWNSQICRLQRDTIVRIKEVHRSLEIVKALVLCLTAGRDRAPRDGRVKEIV